MDDLARTPRSSATPTPGSWRTDAAMAALTGVVTVYLPVQRWRRAARWAMHGGMGALTAGVTGWLMGRHDVTAAAADRRASSRSQISPGSVGGGGVPGAGG